MKHVVIIHKTADVHKQLLEKGCHWSGRPKAYAQPSEQYHGRSVGRGSVA